MFISGEKWVFNIRLILPLKSCVATSYIDDPSAMGIHLELLQDGAEYNI